MLITIESGTDVIAIHDRKPHGYGGLFVVRDGMDGVLGVPAPKTGTVDAPSADGAFEPDRILTESRTIGLDVCAVCRSSVETAALRDRINALAGRMLTIRRSDPSGDRMIRGYLADDPIPQLVDARLWTSLTATLTILCPDPRWVGPEVGYAMSGRRIIARNNGNADATPVVHASGASSLTLTLDGHKVSWSDAEPTDVTIDFADLTPTAGTLTGFDVFTLPPGESVVDVDVTPDTASVSLGVRNTWR